MNDTLHNIVLVEPEQACRTRLEQELEKHAIVTPASDFQTARRWLDALTPRLLITNLRLGKYNGINLTLLASQRTTCIVYTATRDSSLAREVQAHGAFYELLTAVALVVPAYLAGRMPARDRRNPAQDIRTPRHRPERRVTDVERVH